MLAALAVVLALSLPARCDHGVPSTKHKLFFSTWRGDFGILAGEEWLRLVHSRLRPRTYGQVQSCVLACAQKTRVPVLVMRLNGGGADHRPWERKKAIPDYYAELEVGRGVTAQELRKAHKKMMLKYHPDKNAGSKLAQERFLRVQVHKRPPCPFATRVALSAHLPHVMMPALLAHSPHTAGAAL